MKCVACAASMSYIQTPEHRALRAALIRRWKPWERSTGPKTPEGKKKAAMRGFKGAQRQYLRAIGIVLKKQADGLSSISGARPKRQSPRFAPPNPPRLARCLG